MARAVQRVDAALVDASSAGARGSFTRAYIHVTLGDGSGHPGADPLSTALLGALALDPSLLNPLREAYGRWQSRLEQDGIDPADATLVRLAVDGWWTSLVLDLPPLSPGLTAHVRSRLEALST